MDFLVYDVPGRADVLVQADDADSARAAVEAKVNAARNRRVEWKPCGGGELLTVRSAGGTLLGHYYLRSA